MPNYSIEGKILTPISPFKFQDLMTRGEFTKVPDHRALLAVLYYFGLRISEALKLTRESFWIIDNVLYIEVGVRLKHSRKTEALRVNIARPYVVDILKTLKTTPEGERVFNFSRVTGWRIARKAINRYPHFLRLNRITNLFMPSKDKPNGYSIAEVRNFTGLSLSSLNYYIGLVSLGQIGDELK